jgi:predicted RNA-binding Zn ribbon-like protein
VQTGYSGDVTEFRLGLGSLALDLVATVADRPGSHRERLHTPGDLDRWLVEAELIATPSASSEELADARALREAVWSLVERSLADSTPRPADRRLVNEWAARHPQVPQLGTGWSPAPSSRRDVGGALSAVARDAVDLFAGPDRSRIRRCGRCTLHFVDRSRPGNRRWCSMELCGNRSKAEAFRNRQKRGKN